MILTALLIFGLCSCDPYADQFNKMQKEINPLKERVERNEESTASLLTDISDSILSLKNEVNCNARADKDELSARINTLNQILETLESNVDSNDSDRIAEIKLLKSELLTLKSRVTGVEDRVTALESLVARVTALEEAIETKVNKGDFNNLVSDLTSLGEVLTDAVADIETLKTDKADVSTLNTIVDNLEGLISTLDSKVDSNNTTLTSAISDLKGNVETLKSRVTNVESRVTTLETISAKVSDIEALTIQLEEMIEFNEDINSVVTTLASQLADLEDNLESYYKAYEALDSEYALALLTTNEDLEALEKVVGTLNTSLGNTDKEVTTLKRTLSTTTTKVTNLSNELYAQGVSIETLRENLSKIEGRTSNYYHINPTTGEVEAHDFGDGYVKNSSGHYRECKICGYKTDVAPHYYSIHKTNIAHQHYCEECGYVKIDEPHKYVFANFGITEEDWYEDYPTLTDLHVKGTIGARGSWANIYFPTVPNLRRDTSISIFCDECGEETYKVVDDGAGTGEYLLTYAHTVTHEVILEDTGECVLRIGDMDGKRFIYLKNYSVSSYNGNLMMYKWEVVDNTYREYGFEGQTRSVVDEAEVSKDKNIFKCADWNNTAPWGAQGYVIEGDIYYMGFGNGYRTERVGFLATPSGWVESEYGDDYFIYEELY